MVEALKPGDHISDLLEEWTNYQSKMLPHLKEEENVSLPLTRAYFTPKEFEPFTKAVIKKSPKMELGSVIHSMGVDEFRIFMKREAIPSFLWYLVFQGKYKTFVRDFVENIEAVKDGTVPPRKKNMIYGSFGIWLLILAAAITQCRRNP